GTEAYFTPDSALLIYNTWNKETKHASIHVYDLAAAAETALLDTNSENIYDYKATTDHRLLLVRLRSPGGLSVAELWDLTTASKLGGLGDEHPTVDNIDLNPDDKVAYADIPYGWGAFDLTTGAEIKYILDHGEGKLVPGGQFFLSGFSIYDAHTMGPVGDGNGLDWGTFDGYPGDEEIRYEFSPDSHYAAISVDTPEQLHLFDISAPPAVKWILTVPFPQSHPVEKATFAFSPDSSIFMLPMDSEVQFYDPATGTQISSLPSSVTFKPTMDAIFRPDGHHLLVQMNQEISLWGVR
ncbi:MAG TPA: WD40 repeat domain-containing protein, partial [Phototrophicaceae bacterium]|nr:WD40 repeat domain-containing protein [Phototrophicaceae bacterium]